MIIVIGGQKGGVGKTTLAINIAYEAMKKNKKTLLVDADPQESCAKWHSWRKEQQLKTTKLYQLKGDIYDPLLDQENNYELIVVDSGGVDAIEMRSAVLAADILVSPVRPGQFDIETLGKMNQIVKQAIAQGNRTLRAMVVLTHTPTHPLMADEQEARQIIAELNAFSQISDSLKYRSSYWRTASSGLAISEGDDKRASEEMQNVIEEILANE
jgi:chromosome partitioning protein